MFTKLVKNTNTILEKNMNKNIDHIYGRKELII